jgi:hypothetical protein
MTAIRVMSKALKPKYQQETKKAGIRAITTPHMIDFTVISPCTCGEPESVSLFIRV